MLTKFKLALVSAAVLIGGAAGIAAAQPADGVQRTEMREAFKAKMEAKKAEALAKYDVNKDGKLDKTERAAMKADRQGEEFKKLDANGDGQLSLSEFSAMKQHRQGRHGGFHHRGGGKGERGGFGGRGGKL